MKEQDSKEEHKQLGQGLDRFLRNQQHLASKKLSLASHNLYIRCGDQMNLGVFESQELDEYSRICSVETLKVDWESEPSYLHVFIDNTNVIQLQEAKNNIKCQNIMFASASHEFRTPLNAIINSFKIIENSYQGILQEIGGLAHQLEGMSSELLELHSEQIQKFSSIGKHSSSLMLSLVDDILDLSKMEVGTFQINKALFSVPDMLSLTAEIVQPQCDQKNIKMQIDIDPRIRRVRVYSDEKRIKQVLINLLSNSLKFTFSGSVTLSCKQVLMDEKLFAKFMVKDTGIGISQKQQAKLFKMFSMVKYTNQINPNGTGLGLTVSKKYVEALGGSIKLKSSKGAGTTVSFYIPLEDPPLALPHIDENAEHFQSLESVVSFDFIERVHDIKDFHTQTPRFNLP